MLGRKTWLLVVLLGILLFSACGSQQSSSGKLVQIQRDERTNIEHRPPAISQFLLQQHITAPTSTTTAPPAAPPTNIPGTGTGAAPYGPPPPLTAEETQLTQQLFAIINSDRAARGLFPYTWNPVLAGGARLHSWNMFHCGFSHTCPDGRSQCQRIADEGFAGYSDCGENIAYAGPYPTPYDGMHNIQESMVNEPPTGWHRIHLLSTTLHKVGAGIYVDPSGYIWFTEDLVS